MFCGLFNFDENRCIRTLPAWPFCWLIFLVEFFKCWKYPSNSSETFKMLFFHQNNQFEAKTACFADFSILTKIAVSGPYRRGHFVSWFFWLIFWNVENTLPILLKHSKCCSFIKTISMFCGLFNFDENRCIRNLPAWAFFWLIFWNVENTLPILLKHSKCCSFIKTISMFCGLFNFDQHPCIRTLPAWPFCKLIFLVDFLKCWKYPSNSSETFKMLFFHQNNQHVLRNFQFWPKSLHPDLTGVAISLVDFFGWVFQMLKIPFEFFWNIHNFVLSSKQ